MNFVISCYFLLFPVICLNFKHCDHFFFVLNIGTTGMFTLAPLCAKYLVPKGDPLKPLKNKKVENKVDRNGVLGRLN
jgi:hypothetical protein